MYPEATRGIHKKVIEYMKQPFPLNVPVERNVFIPKEIVLLRVCFIRNRMVGVIVPELHYWMDV